jgi:DNA polymerase III alpha subunit
MDIDIDLKSDFKLERVFNNATPAAMVENGEYKRHLVGAYFQKIPKDPITSLAAIPYTEAEDLGFMKIDFLNLALLSVFESKDELKYMAQREPNWDNLMDEEFVIKLFHLGKQFQLVKQVRPRSILEMADVLALMRPSKIPLLNKYLQNRETTRKELYTKRLPADLRKSHAIAYAVNVVINMNLLEENLI